MLELNSIPHHFRDPVSNLFYRLRENLTTGAILKNNSDNLFEEIKNILSDFQEEEIESSATFYRARVNPYTRDDPLPREEMGAPPSNASRGRVQYEGHSILYTADSDDTAIAEIKPHVGAIVSIGKFSCNTGSHLKILDLSTTKEKPSPSSLATFNSEARKHLFSLLFSERGFSRPVHPNDPDRYLETIYIAKIIKDLGYDGVAYKSLQNKFGKNYAYFSPDDFTCNEVGVASITEIKITSNRG